MNEPETARILRRDAPKGRSDEPKVPSSRFPLPRFGVCRSLPVSVEPVMFLTMFSVALHDPLSMQYLWARISEDLGYNRSKTSGCSSGSLPPDPLQKEVEALTAKWNLYINIGGFFVGLLVVPLLGSWSDLAGRRPVLILSNLGLALQAVVYLLVMYLKLPVFYFLVGRILCGLSGDFNVSMAACFSYVADVSDNRTRTFRVAVLEACLGNSGMLAGIIGGKWLQAQGYIKPYWLVLATNLASALYVYLFVRETVTPDPSAKLLTFRHYKAVWQLLSRGGNTSEEAGRYYRTKLWLYLLCVFLTVTVHYGCSSLFVLYELSAPLCWGPNLIGYGSAALHLAYLTSLLGLKLMQRCLADSWVALIGLVSNMAGLMVFSVANTTLLMFTGYALCLLFMTTMPVLRSKLSKLAEPSQQGALFASVGCVKGLCFLVATGLFNPLYAASVHFMKGFPFLVSAAVLLTPSVIIGYLEYVDQRLADHRGAP